jgi:hypothetical protein
MLTSRESSLLQINGVIAGGCRLMGWYWAYSSVTVGGSTGPRNLVTGIASVASGLAGGWIGLWGRGMS